MTRDRIFICYSNGAADQEFYQSFRRHLRAIGGDQVVFADDVIRLGTEWKEEIDKHLEQTLVAVLLISPDFLTSEFIRDVELPNLLAAKERGDAELACLFLRPSSVTHENCKFVSKESGKEWRLSSLQGLNKPDRTLLELDGKGARERALNSAVLAVDRLYSSMLRDGRLEAGSAPAARAEATAPVALQPESPPARLEETGLPAAGTEPPGGRTPGPPDSRDASVAAPHRSRRAMHARFLAALVGVVAMATALVGIDRLRSLTRENESMRLAADVSVLLEDGRLDAALATSLEALEAKDTHEARRALFESLAECSHIERYVTTHDGDANQCLFLPALGATVSCSDDGTVVLSTEHERRNLLSERLTDVHCLALDPAAHRLAAGGKDLVYRWSISDGGRVEQRPSLALEESGEILSLDFSRDGTDLAATTDTGSVYLWRLDGDRAELAFASSSPEGPALRACAFADGRGHALVCGGDDGTLFALDVSTGERRELERPSGSEDDSGVVVWDVEFGPDGVLACPWGHRGQIALWRSGIDTRPVLLPGAPEGAGSDEGERAHRDHVRALRFSPDGSKLVSAGNDAKIVVWDLSGDAPTLEHAWQTHCETLRGLDLGPRGPLQVLTAASEGSVVLWDLSEAFDPLLVARIGAPVCVNDLAFLPRSDLLVYLDETGAVQAYDTRSGESRPIRETVASRPDSMYVGVERDRVGFWGLAVSPSGEYLAAGAADGQIDVWRVDDDRFDRLETLSVTPNGENSTFSDMAFHPTEPWIASASYDGRVFLWDYVNGNDAVEVLASGRSMQAVAFSGKGRWLAFAGADELVRVSDLSGGRNKDEIRPAVLEQQHDELVWRLEFLPDGRLVSAGRDRRMFFWDAERQVLVGDAPSHARGTVGLDFSERAGLAVTGGMDGKIRVMELEGWHRLGAFDSGLGQVWRVGLSRDAELLAACGEKEEVRIWRFGPSAWKDAADRILGRDRRGGTPVPALVGALAPSPRQARASGAAGGAIR